MADLLHTAPCGFLSFADNGTVLTVNATMLELVGFESDGLQGRHINSILSAGGRVFYQTHFFPLLKLTGKAEEIYFSLQSKGGVEVPVLANAVRQEREGRMVNDCIFVAMRHRSRYEDEILQAKQEAQTANRAKDEFLAIVSHELRSPLNAILGWASLMRSGGLDEAHIKHGLEVIERNGKAQVQIIEDILDVTRLTSGKLRLDYSEVAFDEVVREAVQSMEPTAYGKGVSITTEIVPSFAAASVRGDAGRLRQVVWNLLSNAIKFTPAQGEIHIRLEVRGDEVRLEVADNGQGIAASFLPRVFDYFCQSDSSSTRRAGGLGLGLFLVRSLVEMHGGRVEAASEGLGRGTTFRVFLPIFAASPEDSVAVLAESREDDLESKGPQPLSGVAAASN